MPSLCDHQADHCALEHEHRIEVWFSVLHWQLPTDYRGKKNQTELNFCTSQGDLNHGDHHQIFADSVQQCAER
jgi:hypothetical protein